MLLLVAIGLTLTLLGLALVQAATACALIRIDAGEEIGPIEAYRRALALFRPLLARPRHRRRRLGRADRDRVPDPGRDLAGGAVVAARAGGRDRGPNARWTRSAAATRSSAATGCASPRSSGSAPRSRCLAGPFLGALLILVTDAPPALLNVVAGVVYALAMPFVALTTAYVYFDRRTRLELEPERESHPSELPAEIQLSS